MHGSGGRGRIVGVSDGGCSLRIVFYHNCNCINQHKQRFLMKTDVFEILKRASVFMILAQAIIHFRPSPVYEKYIRFLAGIMTAVILFLPMMEVFRKGVQ